MEVFRSLPCRMTAVTPANIGSDAGIKGIISAENDVNAPFHDRDIKFRCRTMNRPRR